MTNQSSPEREPTAARRSIILQLIPRLLELLRRPSRGAPAVAIAFPPGEPLSTFEAVARLLLEDLRAEVAELKGRVNGLLWTVAVAVVVDLIKTLLQ